MIHSWTFCCSVLAVFALSESTTRTYYIGIRENYWNYSPSDRNKIKDIDITHDLHAPKYLVQGPTRIGSVYKKALYKEYTDKTFTTEVTKPNWLGFLGPVIRAEVGDEIVVHLKNFATRPYSIHPHGVLYKKESEGAWYPDGTSGRNKSDDTVAPGEAHTYTWNVTEEVAPEESDPSCLTSMYHSHVNSPKDIAAGLIGVLLICKKGSLDPSGTPKPGMPREFFLMFSAVDENLSWYLEENINKYSPEALDLRGEEDFQTSNQLHSINGFVYGNLPILEMCLGSPVSWHLFGIGNTIDLHSIHFYGQTLLNKGHRTDVLSLFPATSLTATMIPQTVGKWLFGCQVDNHMHAGMQGIYEVTSCDTAAPTAPSGHVRHYYIAAEETYWHYAPSGINRLTNKLLNESDSYSKEFFSTEEGRLGGNYTKVRYIGYHDDTFTSKIDQSGSEHHLGILGPVIRGEPGDVIEVTFRNKAHYNFSMQPHGVSYDKLYEGVLYQDGSQKPGASVAPGQTFVYRWRVTEGPSDSDPPCLSYLYYSGTNPVNDTNSGLVGPLQVCKKGVLDESGRQHIGSEVQKEFFLLFTVMDENKSWYLEKNINEFGNDASDPEIFQESNKMPSVNGFMYGNLPNLDLFEGDHVVWHLMGLGSVDLHGVYFQGNTFQLDNTTRDTLSLFPHSSVTISMKPDNDGAFELSCLTTSNYRGGMRQLYTVKPCKANPDSKVTTFQPDVYFYLAAEEVEWDYAPNRTWELEKFNKTADESYGSLYLTKSENRIGSKYKKVVYRRYKDETFTRTDDTGPNEEHLGILGPILRVQVGEKVQVVFKNKATRPFSVHAHGVKTSKAQPVDPDNITRYNWSISSGPGPTEPKCATYVYYSSVDFTKDLASGLVGPLVVCRKGTLNETRQQKDVDKEFALLFMIFDENESWYLEDNIKKYLNKDPETFSESDGFLESNMMHGINGKLYANLPGLTMQQGDRTQWYLMALGSDEDMHTVHFHDQSFIYKTDHAHKADVYGLFPGTFKTVELRAGTPGTWLLHCHVADHIDAGMETTYTINANAAVNSKAWTNDILFVQWFCRILLAITPVFWLQ